MIDASSSLTDVAFAVSTALDAAGFTVVLTGGSAATFYAPDAYQSADIDFVVSFHGQGAAAALAQVGYRLVGDHYEHASVRFPLEFPPGPLKIGDDLVTTWSTFRKGGELLHVLTPTDSCRDRLAHFLYWNDFSGLEQSLHVRAARPNEVDLDAIREWCLREGHEQKFALFEGRI